MFEIYLSTYTYIYKIRNKHNDIKETGKRNMPRTSTSNNTNNTTSTTTNVVAKMNETSNNNVLQPKENNSNINGVTTINTTAAKKLINNNNTIVGKAPAKTPILKLSTTRRQRRSNKRSGGQRLPSSNYLKQMGQRKDDDDEDDEEDEVETENNNKVALLNRIDPMERGRRSGRKKPSNVGIDGEGFEDPSQFFKSPNTTGNGGRLSTDVESTPGGYTDTERDLSLSANNNIVDGISPTSRRSSVFNKDDKNDDGVTRRRGLFENSDNNSISNSSRNDDHQFDNDDDDFTQPQLQKSSSSSSSSSSSNNNSSPRFQDQSPIQNQRNSSTSPSIVSPTSNNNDDSLDASAMTPQSEESQSSPNSNKSTSPSEQSDQYDDDENDITNNSMMVDDDDEEGLVKSPSANSNNNNLNATYSPGDTAGGRGGRHDTTLKRMRSAAAAMPSPVREKGQRRSKRVRRQPIEWWKNERILYERKTNEGLEAVLPLPVGVERLGKSPPTKKKRTRRKEEIKLPDDYKEEAPKITIDIGDTTTEIELVKKQEDLTFQTISTNTTTTTTTTTTTPNGENTRQKEVHVDAAAAFVHDTIRTGMVKLDAGATKETESSGDAAQMFCVHKAAQKGLLVNINSQTTTVGPGCMFLVPPNTEYELKNLSRKTGIEIFYTIVDV